MSSLTPKTGLLLAESLAAAARVVGGAAVMRKIISAIGTAMSPTLTTLCALARTLHSENEFVMASRYQHSVY